MDSYFYILGIDIHAYIVLCTYRHTQTSISKVYYVLVYYIQTHRYLPTLALPGYY